MLISIIHLGFVLEDFSTRTDAIFPFERESGVEFSQ